MQYDTIIIGAGAAGASAAIYATRYSLKTLMLGGPLPGGLITEALDVENYPGYLSISGQELAKKFIDQAVALGSDYKIETANAINPVKGGYMVETSNGSYETKTVIIATGTHHRKLGIPGEEEYSGRGVSYCSTCDAPFFKDKVVAVAGGGNSAVEGAQDLSMHASKVYIIYRSSLKAAPFYIDQLRKNKKVIEIADTNVLSVEGSNSVEKLNLDNAYEGSNELSVDGLFIQIGYQPKNNLPKSMGIELTDYGYVKVDPGMGTSVSGVFCAGDVNDSSNQLHQQVTSAAEGAIAAQSAYRHILGTNHVIS